MHGPTAGQWRPRVFRRVLVIASAAVLACSAAFFAFHLPGRGFTFQRALGFQVLDGGKILVTDGGGEDWSDTGSKVFVIDAKGHVLRLHDKGLRFAHSAIMLASGSILVPDTNADRLVELDASGKEVWSSASWGGGTGLLSDGTRIDYPNSAQELPGGRFLVSSRYTSTVLETDRAGKVYWSYKGASKQHAPRWLANGNTLIADSDGNRIVEVDPSGKIAWQFSKGLRWPRYAQRLENGDTLITDSNNNRVVEVDPAGETVFEYGRGILSAPYQAEALADGSIMIADAQHGRLLRVGRDKRILWKYERKRNPVARWLSLPGRLENGGAERAAADGKPDRWIACDLTAPDGAAWARDAVVKAAGGASLSISATEGLGLNRWWGQYVRHLGRGDVTLKGLVRTRGVSQGAGLSLNFIDARGGIIGGANSPSSAGDTDWRQAIVRAPVPKGTVAIGVTLSLIGPGQAWWDEVELTR
jgi:sugar lactone lactonase YvrE